MPFSFDPALPTARDRIRHAVGDTDSLNPLREDETIDGLLAGYDEATATAMIARSLASQFARQPSSVTIPGGPSLTWGERVKAWLDLARRIEDAVGSLAGASQEFTSSVRERFEVSEGEYRRSLDAAIPGF